MKRILKTVFAIIIVIGLLAPATPVYAIGFEAEKVYESVFVVYTDDTVGSGFAIGVNCIVTNAHVVENANNIVVTTYSGNSYEASIFAIDDDLDIAVLVVSGTQFQALSVADIDTCKIGDDIYTIGAPDSMAYTLTKGIISAKERTVGRQTYIQIDAAINAGNSGGPLLNDSGEVLGINTLKMSDSEGIGLAIPMDTVCEYLVSSGIELDDNNNVLGILEIPEVSEMISPVSDAANNDDYSKNSADTVLLVFLCLSGSLNIVLITVLICKKKKRLPVKADPSERTDFEIEIED